MVSRSGVLFPERGGEARKPEKADDKSVDRQQYHDGGDDAEGHVGTQFPDQLHGTPPLRDPILVKVYIMQDIVSIALIYQK
jgi:hypothetical protein